MCIIRESLFLVCEAESVPPWTEVIHSFSWLYMYSHIQAHCVQPDRKAQVCAGKEVGLANRTFC